MHCELTPPINMLVNFGPAMGPAASGPVEASSVELLRVGGLADLLPVEPVEAGGVEGGVGCCTTGCGCTAL